MEVMKTVFDEDCKDCKECKEKVVKDLGVVEERVRFQAVYCPSDCVRTAKAEKADKKSKKVEKAA